MTRFFKQNLLLISNNYLFESLFLCVKVVQAFAQIIGDYSDQIKNRCYSNRRDSFKTTEGECDDGNQLSGDACNQYFKQEKQILCKDGIYIINHESITLIIQLWRFFFISKQQPSIILIFVIFITDNYFRKKFILQQYINPQKNKNKVLFKSKQMIRCNNKRTFKLEYNPILDLSQDNIIGIIYKKNEYQSNRYSLYQRKIIFIQQQILLSRQHQFFKIIIQQTYNIQRAFNQISQCRIDYIKQGIL
ncbi:unnamed protein product [Paramecium pentaurelia]|uniref:Transmembrane protein n=1 Tax=Paramecium pentaurelia TaxID=43138 RepID=A0A8S1X212_9CILI|nr:unnamed protein product [Paramecium pentaurelia]